MSKSKKRKYKQKLVIKKIYFLTIENILLFMLFFGITMFISNNLNEIDKIDTTTNFLTFAYKENKNNQIQLRAINPVISNKNSTNYFEFKITNTNNKAKYYKIILHPKTKLINGKNLKIYLTDENNLPLPGFDKEAPVWTDFDKQGKDIVIHKEKIEKNETKIFRIATWLEEESEIQEELKDFSFNILIKDANE